VKFYSGKDYIGGVSIFKQSTTADQFSIQLLQWPWSVFWMIF